MIGDPNAAAGRVAIKLHVIDSHTSGEPTRLVIEGGPDLGAGTVADKLNVMRRLHDRYRSAIVNEPRGSDVFVGGLLCAASDRSCAAGVIFFNNVGYLGMCGHGTIGLVRTLAHLGRIAPGTHRIETAVGIVTASLQADGTISIENVPSHRAANGVAIDVPGLGVIRGDVAWGGNWFFLIEEHAQHLEVGRADELIDVAWRIRQAVNAQGFPEVDHVELFGPPTHAGANSRNFVLCPGKAYDRSPCGTGTSAKLACLAADGKLDEGAAWIQESLIGSLFSASYRWLDRSAGIIAATISSTAFVTAEATLILDDDDPFCWGIQHLPARVPH